MMPKRMRKVHLDFHTSPLLEGVGSEFDPDRFAGMLKQAHVDSVCCFAKCVHGMSYYDTQFGTRHPHLEGDLLGEMVQACKANDIAVSAYYCVMWESAVAREHPDWVQMGQDGNRAKGGEYGASFPVVCLNSPYVEQIVLPQVDEIARNYDVDGMFFDIVYFKFCYCPSCRNRAKTLGVELDGDRGSYAVASAAALDFLGAVRQTCDAIRPGLDITHNGIIRIAPDTLYAGEDHFEVEIARPTALRVYLPFYVRYLRNKGKPVYGITGRFEERWRQHGTLVEANRLRYDTATLLANCAGCSIGDHPYPSGRLEGAVYDLVGTVYAEVEGKEPWCAGAVPAVEAAIVCDYDYSPHTGLIPAAAAGALKILRECHLQFDVIDIDSDFSRYKLLVLPENKEFGETLTRKLTRFVAAGGRVIACTPAISDENRKPLEDIFGIQFHGEERYTAAYILPVSPVNDGIPNMPLVVYGHFMRVVPSAGAKALAKTIAPYFEWTETRSGDQHAPQGDETPYPSAVQKGKSIFLAAPVFSSYAERGTAISKKLVRNCLQELLPERMILTNAPSTAEITVTEQPQRTMVHLVNWHPMQKVGTETDVIEDVPPLYNIELAVNINDTPEKVALVPSGESLAFKQKGNQVTFVIPRIDIHQMIAIEHA